MTDLLLTGGFKRIQLCSMYGLRNHSTNISYKYCSGLSVANRHPRTRKNTSTHTHGRVQNNFFYAISTLKLAPGLHSLHGVDKTARTTLPQFAIYRPKLSCFSFSLYYFANFVLLCVKWVSNVESVKSLFSLCYDILCEKHWLKTQNLYELWAVKFINSS